MTNAATTPTSTPPAMLWTGAASSGLFGLFMAMDIVIKLIRIPQVAQTLKEMGWPGDYGFGIGLMELVFVILYFIPRTSVLGAVLMTGVLGGAVASHVRIADPLFSHILFGVYLGLFMWGGLWLRSPRLRAIFPYAR